MICKDVGHQRHHPGDGPGLCVERNKQSPCAIHQVVQKQCMSFSHSFTTLQNRLTFPLDNIHSRLDAGHSIRHLHRTQHPTKLSLVHLPLVKPKAT